VPVAHVIYFNRAHFALAAIAASTAALTQMITARVLGAIHADVARRFTADGTDECASFHLLSRLELARTGRRFPADHTAAALRLFIGNLEILLHAGRKPPQIIPQTFPAIEIVRH
jgi:membrane-associated phospholipid phosphatase